MQKVKNLVVKYSLGKNHFAEQIPVRIRRNTVTLSTWSNHLDYMILYLCLEEGLNEWRKILYSKKGIGLC